VQLTIPAPALAVVDAFTNESHKTKSSKYIIKKITTLKDKIRVIK